MTRLLLATQQGLVIAEKDGQDWREAARALPGRRLTSVVARGSTILAGAADGMFRSVDGGQSWQEAVEGLSLKHIRWLFMHPDVPELAFAGTEPAAIFISRDAGLTWRICPEVSELRDRLGWSLPYSPEAGCVRGFAFLGTRGYAAVEVGGVLRSDDSGDTWELVEGSRDRAPEPWVDPDVHSISVHAWSRDAVFAPTGGGLFRSTDGGATWALLYECYCRAAWVDPEDPQHIVFGPADGVDRNGRIEATNDGGLSWIPASGGQQVPWRRWMAERITQVGDSLVTVLSNGEVLAGPLSAEEWRSVLPSAGGVTAICEL